VGLKETDVTATQDVQHTGASDLPWDPVQGGVPPEGSFRILGVDPNVRDVQLTHGMFKSYRMELGTPQNERVAAEWLRKASSPAPQVGELIEGYLQPPKDQRFPPSFKQAQKQAGGFSGPRPEDPKRAAAIQRMHSQKVALEAIRLAAEIGVIEKPADSAALFALVGKTADWFDNDVQRVREQS
jgi:hypothetical protein